MPDVLRIVTFSAGGRPVETLNLNSSPGAVPSYFRERGTFQFAPGTPSVQYSRRARRFGGGRAVGETHDNGTVSWTAYVRGATVATAVANIEALVATINDEARGRYIEWAPEGGQSSFMEIAGPGTWAPAYEEFVQTNAMRVQLAFPVFPLVRWAPCTVKDPFTVNSIADYTLDAGTTADLTIASGVLSGISGGTALTSERRGRHTQRGYKWKGGNTIAGLKATPDTVTNFKAGLTLRAQANTYIEGYVDDNGTNSRLRIDVVLAGVRTNRYTANLVSRIVSGTPFWLTFQESQDQQFRVSYYTFEPGPTAIATLTSSTYTLDSVGFGPENTALIAGDAGWTFIPQTTAAKLDDFYFCPFARSSVGTPGTAFTDVAIPGTAPALASVNITQPAGVSAAPKWALMGWTPYPTLSPAASSVAPFAVIQAENGTDLINWTSTADANAQYGLALKDTVGGAESYAASFLLDPSVMTADAFTDSDLLLEVWARVLLDPLLVSPAFTIRVQSADGAAFGTPQYSNEWGTAGVTPPLPTTATYRYTRLGTVNVSASASVRRTVKLFVTATTGAGSSGTIGLDELIVLPASSRALGPTGKVGDATYPSFIASTSQTTKTISSDLSAVVSSPPNAPIRDHGLGGSLLELPPGITEWLFKFSTHVPDDPTGGAVGHEGWAASVAISLDVVPRSFFLRVGQ
jgi:hypothetical protein